VRLQNLFMGFQGVDEQRFFVAQPKVSNERGIWPSVMPFQMKPNRGWVKENLEELAEERVVILIWSASCQAALFAHEGGELAFGPGRCLIGETK
jgi:hypothetical protein